MMRGENQKVLDGIIWGSALRKKVKCIAIVRTDWYNIARKGNTKIF